MKEILIVIVVVIAIWILFGGMFGSSPQNYYNDMPVGIEDHLSPPDHPYGY